MPNSLLGALNQLFAAYARCIDDGDLDAWPEYFDEQCLYKITTADNHRRGLDGGIVFLNSRGMLRDRVSSLREANIFEQQTYRHLLGQPCIQQEEANEIRSETPFLVVRIMHHGTTDIFATGRYLDRLSRSGNALTFRERIVVCDSSRFDTLLALPL